jgi:acyl transferase domain-containing protein
MSQVAGSNTSVYAGIFTHDYHDGLMRDEDRLPRSLPIGTPAAMASNRISHFFDLRGASITVDTGCSSALVALHQAVLGLRAREADMAIVSGCNLMLAPDMFRVFSSLGMLGPEGKSYAFDSRARSCSQLRRTSRSGCCHGPRRRSCGPTPLTCSSAAWVA